MTNRRALYTKYYSEKQYLLAAQLLWYAQPMGKLVRLLALLIDEDDARYAEKPAIAQRHKGLIKKAISDCLKKKLHFSRDEEGYIARFTSELDNTEGRKSRHAARRLIGVFESHLSPMAHDNYQWLVDSYLAFGSVQTLILNVIQGGSTPWLTISPNCTADPKSPLLSLVVYPEAARRAACHTLYGEDTTYAALNHGELSLFDYRSSFENSAAMGQIARRSKPVKLLQLLTPTMMCIVFAYIQDPY